MGSLLEYARLANAAYKAATPGAMALPAGWSLVEANVAGAGFKGATFRGGGEMVVAFAGTEINRGVVDAVQDITADIRLPFEMPRQTSKAYALYLRAAELLDGRTVRHITITGHSLGGALTQHVGYWTKSRFVSWNAPGVYMGIQGTKAAIFHSPQKALRTWKATFHKGADGYNYRLPNDPISVTRGHYGRSVITMDNGLGKSGHSMNDVVEVCQGSVWGSRRPFGP
jgi:hypothetical protein